MATRASSSPSGSATVTIDPSPSPSAYVAAPPPPPPPPPPETVALRLKRRAMKKVSWNWKEGTLGRKSSKMSCIFHNEVPFDLDDDCSGHEAPNNPPPPLIRLEPVRQNLPQWERLQLLENNKRITPELRAKNEASQIQE